MNAVDAPTADLLEEAWQSIEANPDVRVVILTGSGDRAFCAGADLAFMRAAADYYFEQNVADGERIFDLMQAVDACPKAVVGRINGAAIGAGLCIALACDTRIAARDAKLGLNFTRLGIHPGMGATWNLPRIVGPAHAAELLFTGRILDGAEAERIGLVNRAVDVEAVLPEALEMARAMALSAPIAVRGTKRALARSLDSDLAGQLDFEAHQQSICCESADLGEGLAAGRAKRPPRFSGN